MKRRVVASLLGALGLALPSAVLAQAQPLSPQSGAVVQQQIPPSTVVKQVAPDAFVVTNLPGLATVKQVRLQNFSDYDFDHDGSYGPMEFAQALYFLATGDPVAGTKSVPAPRQYSGHLPSRRMDPKLQAALLNATSDEFTALDTNHDWRITPAELAAHGAAREAVE